tara:strand:+ start:105 stop:788 length:684 start_codon:yes stop_codon:yes gene_type:complete
LKVHGVLLAAGTGKRFQKDINKAFYQYREKPLLYFSLKTFTSSNLFSTITVIANKKDLEEVTSVVRSDDSFPLIKVIEGGKSRHESEQLALKYLYQKKIKEEDLISIHDAARPFLELDVLKQLIGSAKSYGSSVPIIKAGPIIEKEKRKTIPNQEGIHHIQTPQTFQAKDLYKAYKKAREEGWEGVDTVDCISRYTKVKARVVNSSRLNMKITYLEDIEILDELIGM